MLQSSTTLRTATAFLYLADAAYALPAAVIVHDTAQVASKIDDMAMLANDTVRI